MRRYAGRRDPHFVALHRGGLLDKALRNQKLGSLFCCSGAASARPPGCVSAPPTAEADRDHPAVARTG
jgi:hypothetical protein